MRSLGLDGRALLPLIVGFGCNLPALAATRILPNARQRLLTGWLIPLTSCSARLTVNVLLAKRLLPRQRGHRHLCHVPGQRAAGALWRTAASSYRIPGRTR